MTAPGAPAPLTRNQKLLHGVIVLLVYAVIGPALGGLFVFCVSAALLALFGWTPSPNQINSFVLNLYELLTFSVMAGYAFGGLQAIVTGAYLGFKTIREGYFTRNAAVFAAIASSLLYILFIYSPTGPLGGDAEKMRSGAYIALLVAPIGVVCALLCRGICVRLGFITTP